MLGNQSVKFTTSLPSAYGVFTVTWISSVIAVPDGEVDDSARNGSSQRQYLCRKPVCLTPLRFSDRQQNLRKKRAEEVLLCDQLRIADTGIRVEYFRELFA
jgi:hypothetical protein